MRELQLDLMVDSGWLMAEPLRRNTWPPPSHISMFNLWKNLHNFRDKTIDYLRPCAEHPVLVMFEALTEINDWKPTQVTGIVSINIEDDERVYFLYLYDDRPNPYRRARIIIAATNPGAYAEVVLKYG